MPSLCLAVLPPSNTRAVRITDVRLAGGASRREGLLQVRAACVKPDGSLDGQGAWYGKFCQTQVNDEDYEVGVEPDALPSVICRQLGFAGGRQQYFNPVPPLNNTELAGNLICRGDEASVTNCYLNSGG